MLYIAGLSLCRILVAQPGADFTIEATNVARRVIQPAEGRTFVNCLCEGKAMKRLIAVSLLGLAYLVATPLMAITVFEDGGKAYADSRDVGHKKGDKNGN
ncbi:hypothetical protein LOF18_30715 [Sinorhizobium meliloti]|nr:hypothetical protein [Sinorhizobium meliloti]